MTTRNTVTFATATHAYDALVLAPGAAALRPPLPGVDLPGIFALKTIPDRCGLVCAGAFVCWRACVCSHWRAALHTAAPSRRALHGARSLLASAAAARSGLVVPRNGHALACSTTTPTTRAAAAACSPRPCSKAVKAWIASHEVKHAVVIGGGFIGLETVENLLERGIKATLLEAQAQVVATPCRVPHPRNARANACTRMQCMRDAHTPCALMDLLRAGDAAV